MLSCPKAVKLHQPTSDLACKYAGDPVAGLVEHLSIPNTVKEGMGYYVAILAATILIIATNAGIIGVSRLTYSMGQHRQLPESSGGCIRASTRPTSRSSSTARLRSCS